MEKFDAAMTEDLKMIIDELASSHQERRLVIYEPPHFFCSHEDESTCARVVTKRKREEVIKQLDKWESYIGDVRSRLEQYDEKSKRIARVSAALVSDAPAAAPAAPAVVPAPVAPVVPAPTLKPVPKGSATCPVAKR